MHLLDAASESLLEKELSKENCKSDASYFRKSMFELLKRNKLKEKGISIDSNFSEKNKVKIV